MYKSAKEHSEVKQNVPPLRPPFSLLSHPLLPTLSLMFSHNALMRCELMRWFEMGLLVIPLSIHLSITAIAASVRPAATAHKRKWHCVCGWAKKKKKNHQMMQSNKYCFSYGSTFNVVISMITFDMSQLAQSLKHFQPFQLQLVHDKSLLWSFYYV